MSEIKDKQDEKLKQGKNLTKDTKIQESEKIEEIGGPKFEPTTHGDWQVKGRCSDF